MWFTENPWPGVIVGCVLAVVLFLIWSSQKRGAYLIGSGLCLLLAAGLYWLELAIVTEAELVEQRLYGLVTTFQRGDEPGTKAYFSQSEPLLLKLVELAISRVEVGDDLRVSDVQVSMAAENSLATTHFRANATVSVDPVGNIGFQPSRWRLRWRSEAGEWKVIEVQRLHPIRDDEIQVFGTQ